MASTVYRRGRRRASPPLPRGEILFESPPELPEATSGGAMGKLLGFLPMLAGGGSLAFMFTSGQGGSRILIAVLMAVSMLGMSLGQVGRKKDERRRQINDARRDYLRYLEQLRGRVRQAAARQTDALRWRYPGPDALPAVPLSGRLWERRPGDNDFGHVRLATGAQQFALKLIPPETKPVEDLDPVCSGALRRFIRAHNTVPDLPVAVGLRSFSQVRFDDLGADRDAPVDPSVRATVRAMLCHLAAFHAPADLLLAACLAPDRRGSWDWLKWLPHALHPQRQDAVGRVRLVAASMAELEELLSDQLDGRSRWSPGGADGHAAHLVIVLDGGHQTHQSQLLADPPAGVTVLDVQQAIDPPSADGVLRLGLDEAGVHVLDQDAHGGPRRRLLGRPDGLSTAEAEAFARSITGFRSPAAGSAAIGSESAEPGPADRDPVVHDLSLTSLLRIEDAGRLDLARLWAPRPARDRLRIPFGVGPDGRPVELDIKESAQGGMGPHGLVIGATGSGKSELLRTLVLGMAATHSSDLLNLVLVDFKGGATFLGLDELPHVSAVITNLEEELVLVDRMHDAIAGEVNRRQELLRHAGNFANLRDYEAAREAGADLDPLPSLWIVVDEFSELLSAKPEFIDLFVMIGRLGRSLGVHLLLASQRLEEGRLRGLDTHLSYRIGLRTFSASESRSVLGVPDAYELPPEPGHGYLKFAAEPLERFRTAYVGADYRPPAAVADGMPADADAARAPATVYVPTIAAYSTDYAAPAVAEPVERAAERVGIAARAVGGSQPGESQASLERAGLGGSAGSERPAESGQPAESEQPPPGTVFDVMVGQLVGNGRPAHAVWLPPLDQPSPLTELLPDLQPLPELGLQPADWPARGRLRAPIGLVDRPYEQRRDPMWVDLSGAGGNVGVVGAPQSGKSTLLRSLICSFALTHTPAQVQFYCLDFGGGALATVAGLPHVGGVAARLSADAVRRTVAELSTLLDQREAAFAEHGVDSIGTYRRMRADGRIAADRFAPDVFLVIDGWTTLRQRYDALEAPVAALAARGLGYGIHVVLSAGRWMDFRANVKDLLQTRLELRLGDPYDSEFDRKAAANVPAGRPGRGLTPQKLHFLAALPRIDGRAGTDDLADGVRDLCTRVAHAAAGEPAPPVRLLPELLPESALPAPAAVTNAAPDSPDRLDPRVPIGIDENELAPVYFDFAAEPHAVILGANECGKSSLMDLIARQVVARNTPTQARIVMLDYRRAMLDSVSGDHLIGYAASSDAANTLMKDVAAALRKRQPGPDITPDQLRSRSWWTGPDLYVLVDDYELVATSTGNPLAQLAELTSQALDIGLHIVLSRGFGGAGRAMYDPIIARIRDMGCPGLIMSGTKDEGALWGGVRGEPLPAGRGRLISRRLGSRLVQTAYGGRVDER